MKKKILINLRLLQQPYTGVQSYVYNLLRALVSQSRDFDFYIIVVNYDNSNTYINDLLSYKNVHLVSAWGFNNNIFGVLFDIFFINKYIKKYDLYFSPVDILPFFKNRKVPHIVGVLDLCTFIVPKTTTLTLKTYYDIYLKTSLKRADSIVTISNCTKNDLLKLFKIDESMVKVVHLGIDRDLKSGVIPDKRGREILKGLCLTENTKYFLTMGTSKRKNVEKTIEAFSKVAKINGDLKLVVVVNNREMESIINRSVNSFGLNSNQVVLTDRYISALELKVLYAKAVCLVYCPYYEGFGLPILEAMQNSCPVITSDNSSLIEICGDAALLANAQEADQIAECMNKMLTNDVLRNDLIQKGLTNSKKYSWEISAAEFDTIFKNLL
ncbi:glycosyltransferase family 4 protein [Patescibacteria group bacterium]|nr:glycosyltransferase family 4 protein [Patescibacteria group bacterium]MBU1953030.1 glycosyltransferase family 4 protein [Patescibacteria group bacterium]